MKTALGFHSARTLTPEAALEVIGDRVKAGLARRAELKPYLVQARSRWTWDSSTTCPPKCWRTCRSSSGPSAHSVRFRAKDMVEATSVMEFIGEYRPDLTP